MFFQSTGTFFAAARYGSATPVPPPVISRGTGWLGVGVLINGMFGCITGTTASVPTILQRVLSWRFEVNPYSPLYVGEFNDIITVIFMSDTTVAALLAFFFDLTLNRENDESREDCGLKWWEKFSIYKSNVRNDEFYALPCCLNKLFPAL
ncbi:hypothetical protein SLEP1_g23480 [Rubroshorea leprosula]|uniref:Uncharacterized protein n=1 Tax=Rubroshorea leprosula TaxID=152421 RepID=A0AAV5JHR4_9ROSI|nr:hypothetical protein SLEP1_g23480 [Rubroshorea leprosula]